MVSEAEVIKNVLYNHSQLNSQSLEKVLENAHLKSSFIYGSSTNSFKFTFKIQSSHVNHKYIASENTFLSKTDNSTISYPH
ncbi:hypothetical protein HOF65_00105 [bacterium]|nr:hypothetical protein [bacterium]MBT3852452.1 hypothetical protein [bacterium]MBT4632796.1 hypothetical protein [bacterium]MBT6779093.1 hypothetical protein [bacterium]